MKSNFKKQYPDFASIEHHIRRAHAERSVYIGTLIADAIVNGARGLRNLFAGPDAPAKRSPRGKVASRARLVRASAAR